MEPIIHSLFESQTSTWQYIIACPQTKQAAIIDSVLDFDQTTLSISTHSADHLLSLATSHGYTIVQLLETHAHADHLSAAYYIQQKLLSTGKSVSPVPIGTGHRIRQVQDIFAQVYGIPRNELDNAFDHLLQENETFQIGNLTAKVLHLPGHTPDHSGYMIGSNVFTGDSIFNPDVGSARCDFPNGDARALYNSMQTLLSLPDDFKLYTGHDYPPSPPSPSESGGRREAVPFVTVREQKERNKHVKMGTAEEEFVQWRRERDGVLTEPRLMYPAVQVNIRGGRMPCDGRGRHTLVVPVKMPETWCS